MAHQDMIDITAGLEVSIDEWMGNLRSNLAQLAKERGGASLNVNARILHALCLCNGRSTALAPTPENCLRVLRATKSVGLKDMQIDRVSAVLGVTKKSIGFL